MNPRRKIHPDIVYRVLKRIGYNGRADDRKANRKRRLIFAKEFVSKENT